MNKNVLAIGAALLCISGTVLADTIAVAVSPSGRVTELTNVRCDTGLLIIDTEATGQRRSGCTAKITKELVTAYMDDGVGHVYVTDTFKVVRGKGDNVYQ